MAWVHEKIENKYYIRNENEYYIIIINVCSKTGRVDRAVFHLVGYYTRVPDDTVLPITHKLWTIILFGSPFLPVFFENVLRISNLIS